MSRRSHSAATSGWISPIHPTGSPSTRIRAERPGCRNGSAARATVHGTRSASSSPARTPLTAKKSTSRGWDSRQLAGRAAPSQQRAHVVGLVRKAGRGAAARRADLSRGRPAGTRRRPRTGGACSRRVPDCDGRRRAATRAGSCADATGRVEIGFSSSSASRRGCSAPSRRRSAQLWAGEAPADDLVQALGGERVGGPPAQSLALRVRRPEAPWRDGSVAGSLSSPSRRATSSIRSASRVTSPRRNAGHGHVQAVVRPRGPELERVQDLGAAFAR